MKSGLTAEKQYKVCQAGIRNPASANVNKGKQTRKQQKLEKQNKKEAFEHKFHEISIAREMSVG